MFVFTQVEENPIFLLLFLFHLSLPCLCKVLILFLLDVVPSRGAGERLNFKKQTCTPAPQKIKSRCIFLAREKCFGWCIFSGRKKRIFYGKCAEVSATIVRHNFLSGVGFQVHRRNKNVWEAMPVNKTHFLVAKGNFMFLPKITDNCS